MDAEERMKNYHWSESDISSWAKDKIVLELKNKKYEVIKTDIFVKICSRMNNLGLIYIINLDTIKDNKSLVLTNFTSTHEENEGLKDFPWFLDFFKELEGQAILQFSKNVIDIKSTERESVEVPNIKANIKTSSTFTYKSLVNCNVDEFQSFFTNPDFIQIWGRGLEIKDNIFCIGRIQFKIIKEEKRLVVLSFKLEGWKSFTKVEIKFSDVRGQTKIDLKQEEVPLEYIDTMVGMWRENVFIPICMSFGYQETFL